MQHSHVHTHKQQLQHRYHQQKINHPHIKQHNLYIKQHSAVMQSCIGHIAQSSL